MSGGDFDRQQPQSTSQAAAPNTDQFDDEATGSNTDGGARFSHAGPFPPVTAGAHPSGGDHLSASDRAYGSTPTKKPTDLGEVEVKIPVVDLMTGEPRVMILEAVTQMAVSWNLMISNLTAGVEQLVQTIGHPQFKKADAGLMEMIWSKAEGLLTRAAEHVAGTTLAGELGIAAIKKIVAKGDELEMVRIQADEDAFVRDLRATTKTAQLEGVREGGNMYIHKIVDKLDGEFLDIGAKTDHADAWKRGDRGVVGAQASFLKDLQKRADDYTTNIATQADFATGFFVAFVRANHKKRKRSAWRSPFADSEYEDGYFDIDFDLSHSSNSAWEESQGWYMTYTPEATLHCPKSTAVADALNEANQTLWDLNLPVHANVKIDGSAWDKLPEYLKTDRTPTVHIDNGMVTGGAKSFWEWLMRQTQNSTLDVLSRHFTLKG